MPAVVPAAWSELPAPPPRPGLSAAPSPQAPLAGLTVLLVEDSRFACDAFRLVVQRAGARLRRAETLAQARRHLRSYRPDLAVIDLGLPDGRGEDLIAGLAGRGGPPVLAVSGDEDAVVRARRAGAAGFLSKPLGGVGAICRALLALLPERAWLVPEVAEGAAAAPDPLALRDDLARAARGLAGRPDVAGRDWIAGFVAGVARSAGDPALEAAAGAAREGPAGQGRLATALAERLAAPLDGLAC